MLPLILASSSAARKKLLGVLGIVFEVIHPEIDETPQPSEKPADLALRLTLEKAQAAKAKLTRDALIIASDQVIMCGNIRLDKPLTFDNAVRQLQTVSGQSIDSYTGLCLLNTQTNQIQSTVDYYQVHFRNLSQHTIEEYIKRDDPLHCAGSIKAEGLGMTLFTKMIGKDPTALLGLPLISLTDFLRADSMAAELLAL